MRIAALYDIHGNLPALEAVLAELAGVGVDAIVVGGDVVGGPLPRQTLARLRREEAPILPLRGNHEAEFLAVAGGERGPEGAAGAIARWVVSQLDDDDLEALASWPATVRLDLGALGATLFCHATPTSDTAIFTERSPDARVASLFSEADADLAICGHTHMAAERRLGSLRIVVAGSVGMPFGAQGAHWLLLDGARGDVAHCTTPYDTAAAAARVRAGGYPMAEAFATDHVLSVPSADEALTVFARLEDERRLRGGEGDPGSGDR